MKTILKSLIFLLALSVLQTSEAQLLNRLKERAKEKLERKAEQKIDRGLDSLTELKIKKNNTKTSEVKPGTYQFTFETVVRVTNLDDDETYKLSYLLNPDEKYIGINADMSDYSDEEISGESIIVMDNGDSHVFVETQGMKMRMSQGMMGNNQQQNAAEKMANYDYTNLKKTGKTKTILGATCYEYVMSDDAVKMELWVAPDINLPNWFIQNKDLLKGHIMEYTITSKEGNIKSETFAINDHISKIINPKEYKKMF